MGRLKLDNISFNQLTSQLLRPVHLRRVQAAFQNSCQGQKDDKSPTCQEVGPLATRCTRCLQVGSDFKLLSFPGTGKPGDTYLPFVDAETPVSFGLRPTKGLRGSLVAEFEVARDGFMVRRGGPRSSGHGSKAT